MIHENFSFGKILNIGHRGAPGVAPENTVPSFSKAVEIGADGIELDVVLSKDGVIMVFHDYYLQKKTDGQGLLTKYTLPELKALDAGSSFSEEYAGTRIPTLQEVVEAMDKKAFIMIEIKTNPFAIPGIENAVAAVISKYNLYNRVVVSSFNPFSLMKVKQVDRNISVGVLHLPFFPAFLNRASFATMVRPDVLHPLYKMVNESYLQKARSKGYRVIPWTVNDKADMKKMVDMGVDGIITNHPDILQKILQ